MAIKGKRKLTSMRDYYQTWYCECASPNHSLVLAVGYDWDFDDQAEFGEFSVILTPQYEGTPWRYRLGMIWDIIRGRRTPLIDLAFNYADAVSMRDALDQITHDIESRTRPQMDIGALVKFKSEPEGYQMASLTGRIIGYDCGEFVVKLDEPALIPDPFSQFNDQSIEIVIESGVNLEHLTESEKNERRRQQVNRIAGRD